MAISCVADSVTISTSSEPEAGAVVRRVGAGQQRGGERASRPGRPAIHCRRLPSRSTSGAQRNLNVQGSEAPVAGRCRPGSRPGCADRPGGLVEEDEGKPDANESAASQASRLRERSVGCGRVRAGPARSSASRASTAAASDEQPGPSGATRRGRALGGRRRADRDRRRGRPTARPGSVVSWSRNVVDLVARRRRAVGLGQSLAVEARRHHGDVVRAAPLVGEIDERAAERRRGRRAPRTSCGELLPPHQPGEPVGADDQRVAPPERSGG